MSVLETIGGAARPGRNGRNGRPGEDSRRLRVVPDPPIFPSKAPFVVLVLGILGFGLIGLLLLNTSLQQNSFVMHELEGTTAKLEQRQGVLEQRVATLEAPDRLAREAERIGMVPNPGPAFLRLSDGKVLGKAEVAKPKPKPQPASNTRPAPDTPVVPGPATETAGRGAGR